VSVLEVTNSGPLMTITLCDVERRNALSHRMLRELLDAIDVAENDERVRVVLLTNRGSVFCAGANLSEISSSVQREHDGNETRNASGPPPTDELSQLFSRIRSSPKPFVGRLAGHCVAGGVGLAAVLDVAVASNSSTFGFSEVRVGVAPAIISVVCLSKMRRGDAHEVFLRGNRFSADEAVRLGLIASSVGVEQLDEEVNAVVNDLLAGEPHALAVTKQLSRTVPALSETEAYEWCAQLSSSLFQSDAAREGMSAFLEKRPASWVTRVEPTA
jgi:methylglutaconyl-CoA hydratase